MITKAEILMNRDKEFPLDAKLVANLEKLLYAVNLLRTKYGKLMRVSSGYRPDRYNKAAGGSTKSAHLTCEAVDFKDVDNALKEWVTPAILKECGLYMEHPDDTPSWVHVQTRPTKNRIFKP